MALPRDRSGPVFACVDRWGRRVIARQHRWDAHIIGRHPELVDRVSDVEQTVRQPDFVNRDATFPNGEVFYRRLPDGHPYEGHFVKVCVSYGPALETTATVVGEVRTALVTSKVRKGEARKWP